VRKLHYWPKNCTHRNWNKEIEPALAINPGDAVYYETRDASNNQLNPDCTDEDVLSIDWGNFYPLAGPLYINHAEPGDILVVDVLQVQHRGWGWTAIMPDFGLLTDYFEEPKLKIWEIFSDDFTYMNDFVQIPIEPFAGTMGVAPQQEGPLSPRPPRSVGGNMDCKHIIKGSTLYLPVEVDGALFSVGDGHLAQGDSELCGSAIEGPIGITCRFDIIRGHSLTAPEIETPSARCSNSDEFATIGTGQDLLTAAKNATINMLERLEDLWGLSTEDAYILASVAGDLRITEVVNPAWVVSLHMPKDVFLKEPARPPRLSNI